MNPLLAMLYAAARGSFPPPDGAIEVLSVPPGGTTGVLGFSAHFVVASEAPASWVHERLAAGDFIAPLSPAFLVALGERVGLEPNTLDVVLAAPGLPDASSLREAARAGHPRVARAFAQRSDVAVYEDETGATLITLGRGLALRLEVSVEVEPEARADGLARAALIEARRLIGPDETLFAQTAPGNAASLRAILGAGFRPIGSEVLFF